jgi:hypothetical protein
MINEKLFHEKYVHFDKETVVEIIDIFINEYQERIDRISRSLDMRSLENLQKNAHASRAVIGNFDMDTRAFHEISSIEDQTRLLLQEIKEGRKLSRNEDEEFFSKIEKTFGDFKRDSRSLISQLKELRKHYAT